MNVVADENIPAMTVSALKSLGHVVTDLRGTEDQGSDDELLWEMAQARNALLITTDKGFADHRTEPHAGILIIRLRQPNRQKIHDRIMKAVSQHNAESWPNLTVVMRDTVQSVFRFSGTT